MTISFRFAHIFTLSTAFMSFQPAHAQWEASGSGLTGSAKAIFSIDIINENVVWAVPISLQFQDIRDVIRTTDGGDTWDVLELPETEGNHMPQRIFAFSDMEAYVSMLRYPSQSQSRIFRTTDGGATWTDLLGPFNDPNRGVENIHFFNESEGIAFGSPNTGSPSTNAIRIYRTADAGATWIEISEDNLPGPVFDEQYLLFSGNDSYAAQGDTLWFTTTANRIFRTVNRGHDWEAFLTPLNGSNTTAGLASVAFEDHLNGMVVSFLPQEGAVTTNGGATWTPISMPAQPQARNVLYIPNSDGAYLISDGFEQTSPIIAYTLDRGATWGQLDGNPPMNCLAFTSSQSGWGGTNVQNDGQAMYRWNSDWLLNLSTDQRRDGFVTIFPNPAREVIYIRNVLGDAPTKRWQLSDIAGRILASGEWTSDEDTRLDVSTLENGTYLLRMESGGRQVISKFIKH